MHDNVFGWCRDWLCSELTDVTSLGQTHSSALWGASCPRQGNPPTHLISILSRPFSGPNSADIGTWGRRSMSDVRPRRHSLGSSKKGAKRWLDAIHANDSDAVARFRRVTANVPSALTLRDVQLALAFEYGFAGWTALTQSIEPFRGVFYNRIGRSARTTRLLQCELPQSARAKRAFIPDDHPKVRSEGARRRPRKGSIVVQDRIR